MDTESPGVPHHGYPSHGQLHCRLGRHDSCSSSAKSSLVSSRYLDTGILGWYVVPPDFGCLPAIYWSTF